MSRNDSAKEESLVFFFNHLSNLVTVGATYLFGDRVCYRRFDLFFVQRISWV